MKKYVLEKDVKNESNAVELNDEHNDSKISVQDNNIYFYKNVSVDSILELKNKIIKINKQYNNLVSEYGVDKKALRINLHLHTPGGDGYSAFNMVDFMRVNPYKIDTYIEGMCASAGTIISMAGDKRFATENAHILLHQLRGCVWGKYCDIKDETYNYELFHQKMLDFYVKKSKLNMECVKEMVSNEKFIEANEALKLGIVDEII